MSEELTLPLTLPASPLAARISRSWLCRSSSTDSRTKERGSTIGLAGCGIWLIFVAIFGMGAENRSGKREFQSESGSRILRF